MAQAIAADIAETKAAMGQVVGALKGECAGRMGFANASVLVKGQLGG